MTKVLPRVALATLAAMVAAGACELALRWYLDRNQGFGTIQQLRAYDAGEKIPTRSQHPLVSVVRLSPNRRLVYESRAKIDKSFGGRALRTNSAGMRADREYASGEHPGVVRIVGIGDSGMWGWAVHQGEDYLAVLDRNLGRRAAPPRYEVLNLAVPGYNTQQEVEMLTSRGLEYRPDIVLLGWCDNDYGPPLFLYPRKDFFSWDRSYLLDLAIDREEFAVRTRPEILKLGDIDRTLVDPVVLGETGKEGVERQLRLLATLAHEHGFRLLVVGRLTHVIRKIIERLAIDGFDTRTAIPKTELAPGERIYGCHPNAAGHARIAQYLETELDRRGWLAASAPASRP